MHCPKPVWARAPEPSRPGDTPRPARPSSRASSQGGLVAGPPPTPVQRRPDIPHGLVRGSVHLPPELSPRGPCQPCSEHSEHGTRHSCPGLLPAPAPCSRCCRRSRTLREARPGRLHQKRCPPPPPPVPLRLPLFVHLSCKEFLSLETAVHRRLLWEMQTHTRTRTHISILCQKKKADGQWGGSGLAQDT